MLLRIDLRIALHHGAVGGDQIRDALRNRQQRPRSAHLVGELAVAIREQQERQVVLFRERAILLRFVVGDAEDPDAELFEIIPAVTQPVGLDGSTRCVGLRVIEEKIDPAFEVRAPNGGAVMGFELEFDESVPGIQHRSTPFGEYRGECREERQHGPSGV